jgi:hypothetical protein
MTEKDYHRHSELLTRGEALVYAQAAVKVGGVAIRATHNEGELYLNDVGNTSRVPDGYIRLNVSGMPINVQRMHDHIARQADQGQQAA